MCGAARRALSPFIPQIFELIGTASLLSTSCAYPEFIARLCMIITREMETLKQYLQVLATSIRYSDVLGGGALAMKKYLFFGGLTFFWHC